MVYKMLAYLLSRLVWISCLVMSNFVALWTVAHQAPLSMGFSRQGYWSGLPFPTPGDLPDPRIEPMSPVSPALQADSLPLSHQWKWSESESHSVVSDSLRPCGLYTSWNSPGQNTRVGSHSLLQGIFPTQGFYTSWATREAQEYWGG